MIIEIINDQEIIVYGDTDKQVFDDAKKLLKFIGNDRWVSMSDVTFGTLEYRYKTVLEFKEINNEN